MLIAVSVKKPDLSADLSDAFGRSEYFLLFDSEMNASEFVHNPYSSELGGAGIQSASLLIERNIETLITTFIGFNTLRFFNSLKVKVYLCENCNAEESLRLFSEGNLKEIQENNPQRWRRRLGRKFFNNTSVNNQNKKRD
jgi:predicted Fe-Mo cluster-binding NifX family protein